MEIYTTQIILCCAVAVLIWRVIKLEKSLDRAWEFLSVIRVVFDKKIPMDTTTFTYKPGFSEYRIEKLNPDRSEVLCLIRSEEITEADRSMLPKKERN